MADNVTFTTPAFDAATDQVTGTLEHVQLMKLAIATDGSRTPIPSDGTDGLLVNLGANNDISGTVTANLAAGTNNIGDVDVLSVIPGTGATNLGKAEDAGHTTGDVGVMALGVRNDANAAISGTDLDYTPFSTDSAGNVNVEARRDLVRVTVQSAGLTTTASAYAAGDQVGNQFTIAGCARASGGSGTIVGVMVVQGNTIESIGAMDIVFSDSSITLAADNAAYAISDADALKVVGLVQLAGAFDIGNNRICQMFNLAVPYVCSGGTSLYAGLITRSAIAATPFTAATDLQLIVYVERN